jgi:hypothetical protein
MRFGVALIAAILCSVVLSEGFASVPTNIKGPQQIINQNRHNSPVVVLSLLPVSNIMSTVTTTTTATTSHGVTALSTRGGGAGITATPTTNAAKKSTTTTTTTTSLFVSKDGEAVKCPFTKTMTVFGSVWGSFGVIYILTKAVKRVIPIAMEPFTGGTMTLSPFQWRYERMS